MVAPVIIVVDEFGDGLLQLAREFIKYLVHFPLDALVVALQLPVGLRMKWRRQDMPDANEVQIVPEGPADITGTVVREQFGAVLDRHLGHSGSVDSFLDYLDEGVRRHVSLQLPGKDKTTLAI